ncbi:hypothetical protein EDB86DRAFT_2969139 [Lactarius hatsudake]|nr:hypothetical protein EDB86DRAFT_2969139 [Lactarius hatsudake]
MWCSASVRVYSSVLCRFIVSTYVRARPYKKGLRRLSINQAQELFFNRNFICVALHMYYVHVGGEKKKLYTAFLF